MTKYKRFTGKVFGGNATAIGDDPQISQFGSALAGTFTGTTDPEVIQSLPAWGQGWIGAVTPETQFPALPEMTGAMKVLSHQICGIQQQGISDWDNGTIYYQNNFTSKNGKIYISQIDENQGNDPETDTVNWKEFSSGGGLELCDIGLALYVDESKGLRRYLNGQIVDINTNTQAFLNRLLKITTLYPSLLCTEQEWQTAKTMSAFGQVGKFVFNYADDGVTVVSVRIPRVVNIQGLLDLQNLGLTVPAGLPDHSHTYTEPYAWSSAGSSSRKLTDYQTAQTGLASESNPIYGASPTVQVESVQYPYYIQIATGQETENNIKNELELINPYSLFEPKYSDVPLYNASWVISSEAYLSKTVYVTAYEALQVEYNTEIEVGTTVDLPSGTRYTKRGISVKLSTDSSITDYDWVINTENETFRTPLKSKLVGISRSGNLPVVGNGKTLGFTDGTSFAGSATGGSSDLIARGSAFGKSSSGVSYTSDTHLTNSKTCGIATASQLGSNLQNSGLIASLENIDTTGLYLYFYIGDVAQNASLVDVGRIGEEFLNKVNELSTNFENTVHIVKTYTSVKTGYILWSNRLCKQWGRVIGTSSSGTVSFYVQYDINTNVVFAQDYGGVDLGTASTDTGGYGDGVGLSDLTNLKFRYSTQANRSFTWYSIGYIKESTYNSIIAEG